MTDEPFQLTNDPPRKEFTDRERERQSKLFSGMDCLAGQGDLFQTDGESDGQENHAG